MRVLIIGGSIAGLFSATFFSRIGWETLVFERSAKDLSGRGAGIVTHDELINILKEIGVNTNDLGVVVRDRTVVDGSNKVTNRIPFHQVVTSWDRIHQLLGQKCSDSEFFPAHALTGYQETDSGIVAKFENGRKYHADLLVGADGFSSQTRRQFQPRVKSTYSGYVVWRTLVEEDELSSELAKEIFQTFCFYTPPNTQILGYPIPGRNNDLREGHRRYNIVWYKRVTTAKLRQMLTDNKGNRYEITIPPPLIKDDVIDEMKIEAKEMLPSVFQEILSVSDRPFFTPIYDHHSKVMGAGRIALVGDAACVARPHVGMGVTKAAFDAKTLVDCLVKFGDVGEALEDFSSKRSTANLKAHEMARKLGDYIFAIDQKDLTKSSTNPHLQEIVQLTASMIE